MFGARAAFADVRKAPDSACRLTSSAADCSQETCGYQVVLLGAAVGRPPEAGSDMISDIQRVGVIGSGTMGSGIAQVFAQRGFSVLVHDVSHGRARSGARRNRSQSGEVRGQGALAAPDRDDATLGRLTFGDVTDQLAEVDLVVEAIVENEAVKKELFAELDVIVPEGRILASNTSSISITAIGAATKRPELVLGMHFMNPVPIMMLVELVRGQATSAEAMAAAANLCARLGKTPVEAADYPGFISNRICSR